MSPEIALLNHYLVVGALLFGIGLIGFLSRRNMIVMFLALELALQGVSLSLVALSRFHNNFAGQVLVVFIVAVAACEAAIALALVLMLFRSSGKLDVAAWQQLREADQPAWEEPEEPQQPSPRPEWPRVTPAGIAPKIAPEEIECRPRV